MSPVTKSASRSGSHERRSGDTGRCETDAHTVGSSRTLVASASNIETAMRQLEGVVREAYALAQPVRLTIELQGEARGVKILTESIDVASLPPADIEAEQALLGALLYDNDAFENLGGVLEPGDFYEPFHGRLFATILGCRLNGELAEPISVAERFAGDPGFTEQGGIGYLADLVVQAPPIPDAPGLVERVLEAAKRRRERKDVHDPSDELESALREARARGEARAAAVLAGPDMLGADDFAHLIGATRETVRQKLKRREVLGLQGATRAIRYPAWQVNRDGALLPGLPKLFELFGDSAWAVYRFLVQPTPALGGQMPKDRLQAGRVAPVLEIAEGQVRGDFG
jgi:hypothetical protein